MEAKKNPRVNPEQERKIYFHLGMFIVSASVLMAFTWRHPVFEAKKAYFERENDAEDPNLVEEIQIEMPKIETVQTPSNVTPSNPDISLLTPDITITGNTNQNEQNQVNPEIVFTGPISITVSDGPAPDNVALEFVDVDAHLAGWFTYLKTNLYYPEISKTFNEQGKIWVKFIVEKDGTLSDVKVVKGGYKALEKEALRVVKASPKWTPGTLNGEYVRSYKTIAVNFILE